MTEWKLPTKTWERLGRIDPVELVEARLQLHWATQIVSAVGVACLPAASDDSHSSLEWIRNRQALAGQWIHGPEPFRAALSLQHLALELIDTRHQKLTSIALTGMGLEDGFGWMSESVSALSGTEVTLSRRNYEMPEHPVAAGARFGAPEAQTLELCRWFANSHLILQNIEQSLALASPVRCWPHHFDMALLVVLKPDKEPADSPSIGIGLSPGDDSYAQPYWYVSPYPKPAAELPELAEGFWHHEGWTGAVLIGASVTNKAEQEEICRRFLGSAVSICGQILGMELSDA